MTTAKTIRNNKYINLYTYISIVLVKMCVLLIFLFTFSLSQKSNHHLYTFGFPLFGKYKWSFVETNELPSWKNTYTKTHTHTYSIDTTTLQYFLIPFFCDVYFIYTCKCGKSDIQRHNNIRNGFIPKH